VGVLDDAATGLEGLEDTRAASLADPQGAGDVGKPEARRRPCRQEAEDGDRVRHRRRGRRANFIYGTLGPHMRREYTTVARRVKPPAVHDRVSTGAQKLAGAPLRLVEGPRECPPKFCAPAWRGVRLP